MTIVITISGKAEAGKDTTALYFKEMAELSGKTALIIHNADYLKFICKTYFGWDGHKDEKGRKLLQSVGTEVARSRRPDIWVEIILSFLAGFGDDFDFVLIPDCRFPNEIELVKENHSAISVVVTRPFHKSRLTEEEKNHRSETALDGYVFDYHIENNSDLNHLCSEVYEFMNHFADYFGL